jgi:uncharacterized protein YecE (DUF72 family)
MGTSRAAIRVGTSGWRYASWRGDFYPRGLPQRRELEHLASRLTALELNGSFYSLQRPTTYQRIAAETPEDFVVAVKGGRYLTHLRRLRDVRAPLANFLASGVLALGPRLGPVLWQLPPDLQYDEQLVAGFLDLLPRTTGAAAGLARDHDDKLAADRALTTTDADRPLRHALEPRHASFGEPEAVELLRDRGVALVVSDSPGAWPCFDEVTADHVYVRLHGHTELYASGYSSRSLDAWAGRCRAWQADGRDVLVFFDNDARGRAPHDAEALLARLDV